MKRFKSEVDIMRGLKHQHIVQFVGSYTDKTYLGIITSPVADMDLAAFLTRLCGSIRAGSGPEKVVASEMSSTLRSFFGCLAAALAYLHDTKNQRSINLAELLVRMSSSMTAGQGLQSTRLAPISQTNKDRSVPGKGKVESPGQTSSPTNAASSVDDTSVAQDVTSSQGNVAFAVFDYKRQASNEIDLIQGEAITDVVQHESGCSYGHRRNGNHGWFPSAYVAMQISGESSSYEAPKHVSGLGLNQPWFRGVVHVPKDASEPQEALRKIWHAARNSQRKEGGDLAPLIRPKLAMPHLPEAVLCTATKLDHRMRSVLLKARILAS
ncbi:hypothetical protein BKA63DRAFT_137790 [Paraphoma chrysanthemicola]|nr:hypothetical protein BKA63DRAFT_137790 [Paraphoma chrysanthemicola]